ncbi:MAG: hypothetical protein RQ751_05675 [Longimicrobiales bacterium]|nr:hypothetical protein [Longimicrobiales bacterium]
MTPLPPTRVGSPGRRWAATALKLAATALVTVFIVRRVGVDLGGLPEAALARFRVRPLPLAASVAALGGGYLLSAALWGRMVREMGGPRLSARVAVPLFLVANLGRYVPGKVLQITGLTLLARERGVPGRVAAGAAVLGQGVALMGATLVGISALLSPALPPQVRLAGWIGLVVTGAFMLATSLPYPARHLERLGYILARRGTDRAIPAAGSVPVLARRFGLRWTLWYAMNWSLYATAFWLLTWGLVGFHPFLYVAPAFAAAYVGGYIALFAPAGLGVREGLLTALLAPVLDPESALAVAVAARVWTTAVEVVPAALLAPGVLRGTVASRPAGRGVPPEARGDG